MASTLERATLGGARPGRLLFAQVHEDPRLEIECLSPAFAGRIVAVGSGGCTALSLLAAGADSVTAVDLNPTQNHVVELKAAACAKLDRDTRTAFLGGWAMRGVTRRDLYRGLKEDLTPGARAFWDDHGSEIENGMLACGVSERFIGYLVRMMRLLVHPASRIDRLLACATLDEQRVLYAREWNSWRWRLLFKLLLGPRQLARSWGDEDYVHIKTQVSGSHFHGLFEHTVTQLPVADNYFLHYILRGRYGATSDALPLYLSAPATPLAGRLALADAPLTEYLASQPDGSIAGFSLSNICEWLDKRAIEDLFGEIVRTAAPGAVVCFRNFIGWTEVPQRWRARVIEDRARGESLLARDRAIVNRRFAVCTIR